LSRPCEFVDLRGEVSGVYEGRRYLEIDTGLMPERSRQKLIKEPPYVSISRRRSVEGLTVYYPGLLSRTPGDGNGFDPVLLDIRAGGNYYRRSRYILVRLRTALDLGQVDRIALLFLP